jgi:hypothetical protein
VHEIDSTFRTSPLGGLVEVISVSLHVEPLKAAIHTWPSESVATGPTRQNEPEQPATMAPSFAFVEGGSGGRVTKLHELPSNCSTTGAGPPIPVAMQDALDVQETELKNVVSAGEAKP